MFYSKRMKEEEKEVKEIIQPDICLSMDLDKTLLMGAKLSPLAIDIIKLFLENKIPWIIATARSILNLTEEFRDLLESKSEFETIKKTLEHKSFGYLRELLKKKSINFPVICTLYDPCIEEKNQQGQYYLEYDKMIDVYLKLIEELENGKGKITREDLSKKINEIISKFRDDKLEEIKADSNAVTTVLPLLSQERRWRSLCFPTWSPATKSHQFLWTQTKFSCKNIVHVDDNLQVLWPFNARDMNKIALYQNQIIYAAHAPWLAPKNKPLAGVNVYAIPFSDPKNNRKKILETVVRGINAPLVSLIEKLDEQEICLFTFCFCLEATKQKKQTVNYTKSILTGLLITNDVISKKSKTKQKSTQGSIQESTREPLLPPPRKLYFSPELASLLQELSFARFLSLPHLKPKLRKQLQYLQTQLNALSSTSQPSYHPAPS